MRTGEAAQVISHGKFLSRSGRKFFFKAIRLESPNAPLDLVGKVGLRSRLEELYRAHTTGLIVGEAAADGVLDLAAQVGLHVVVEIKVAAEALLDRASRLAVQMRLGAAVRALRGRPGLVGYLIDCPLSADLLRTHGLERLQRRLGGLMRTLRRADEQSLVAIKHRPSTRACSLLDEDLVYSVIPPLSPSDLREYIVSLHNLAEARPVVIEFETASANQDELVSCAFGLGAAGVVAPVMRLTPPADLMTLRMLRADELMPFLTLNGSCPPAPSRTPMVSVVICAYNAERTMRPCLESLRKLEYPNYEVVIVDDGSRDGTAEIAMDFPEFRLIRQPNKGLSVARNVGMHAARGEIVAYTDSDCVVDSHWLTFMVRAMVEGGFDGCGGPNYAPHEDGRIEACVAASPGAPCHVLTGEDRAEHLAGCNMLFCKSALLATGGFDPQFTSAGDDVDICWRMLEAGLKLGFCPSAFVWHFRRNTVKAYYGQQRGYGRAEAMLYTKYPERFNAFGQIKWQGTIPGLARTMPGGGVRRVMWAAARPGLQTVYDPALSLLNFLPQTFEWNLVAVIALAVSVIQGVTLVPALAMLALGPVWALYYAWQAPIEKSHRSFTSRLIVAWLAYSGPIVRALTRYKLRLRGAVGAPSLVEAPARQRPEILMRSLSLRLSYWNETYTTRDSLLDRARRLFFRAGYPAIVDRGWNDYDLEVRTGACTKVQIKTAEEEHGGMRLKTLAVIRVRMSLLGKLALLAGTLATAGADLIGMDSFAFVIGTLTILGAAVVVSEACESLRTAYRAVEQCAAELEMMPLGAKTAAARRRERAASAPLPQKARPLSSVDLLAEDRRLAD